MIFYEINSVSETRNRLPNDICLSRRIIVAWINHIGLSKLHLFLGITWTTLSTKNKALVHFELMRTILVITIDFCNLAGVKEALSYHKIVTG